MRKCPCPVWVMKPAQGKRFARILAAVDTGVTDLDTEHHALNTKIMDLATSLAEQEQSELHIVHAWEMFGESVLRGEFAHLKKNKWMPGLSKSVNGMNASLVDSSRNTSWRT